ncbi:uncharacterized protein V1510DRAFT_403420 [Dipodascopsis tothii]|uniref:uncharacterized protein n=1 Tax=Dipodascopsis tothii TaxID=44089 RepID=UPI0034CDF3EF
MADHEYLFNVAMSCSGCSNAVQRVLNKLNGVSDIQISLDEQSVRVKASDAVSYDTVLATIKKTGKEVRSGTVVA